MRYIALALILTACGTAQASPTSTIELLNDSIIMATETSTSTSTTQPERIEAAVATEVAVRVDPPTTTEAPFDCRAYIDSLPWEWSNREVGNEAYTVGASCRGWDQATIDKWRPFVVDDVWRKESGWCWNLLRGDTVITYVGCVLDTRGVRHEDAGIGQLTRSFYGPTGSVCLKQGYCDKWSIIASPYDSVMAALGAIEDNGKGGYCYEGSNGYHPTCAITPRYWP